MSKSRFLDQVYRPRFIRRNLWYANLNRPLNLIIDGFKEILGNAISKNKFYICPAQNDWQFSSVISGYLPLQLLKIKVMMTMQRHYLRQESPCLTLARTRTQL